MHVLLEGVIPYEMKHMLNAFVSEKGYFTLDTLNERIHCFPYTQEEVADKPSPLSQVVWSSAQSSFHQSGINVWSTICHFVTLPLSCIAAAQMWTLSIYLPLISGDKVPSNEPLWECFLLLLLFARHSTDCHGSCSLSWFSSLLSRPNTWPSQYVSSLLSFD